MTLSRRLSVNLKIGYFDIWIMCPQQIHVFKSRISDFLIGFVRPSVWWWAWEEKWDYAHFRPSPPARDWCWPFIQPCLHTHYTTYFTCYHNDTWGNCIMNRLPTQYANLGDSILNILFVVQTSFRHFSSLAWCKQNKQKTKIVTH